MVVDASVTLSWIMPGETPRPDVLARAQTEQIIVPYIWRLEVLNILLIAEKRGRLSTVQVESFLTELNRLGPSIDIAGLGSAWTDIKLYARLYQLTSYDAAYLELAIREGAALATDDVKLKTAAISAGLTVL